MQDDRRPIANASAGTRFPRDLRASIWTALALGAALSLPGCSRSREAPQPAPEPARAAEAPSARAPTPLTPDEKLAKDVADALRQAPALAHENIHVAASQKLVLLTGQVSAPHLRDEAVSIAGEVPGVESVQSKIVVKRP